MVPITTRCLGWKPDRPDQRDKVFKSRSSAKLPAAVDLRSKWEFTPFDQGDLGSCTANAIAGALVFTEQQAGAAPAGDKTLPSRLAIYWWERYLEGSTGSDAGAQIRDGLKVVATNGYIDESRWPYKINKFKIKPPAGGVSEKVTVYKRVPLVLSTMKRCLADGFPFVFGISVYESFMNADDGTIPMPAKDEDLEGGHAILCMGYDNKTSRFLFLNSWGVNWGDGGYGTIPYAYLTNSDLGSDYWTIRQET